MEYQYQSIKLSLIKEESIKYPNPINGPSDLANLAKSILGNALQEHFMGFYLNNANILLGIRIIHIGTVDETIVHPRDVFIPALLTNAAGVVICHNHPSGNPRPSNEDKLVTDRIKKAGEMLGIGLLDHIIIGDKSFYVFSEEEMFPYKTI